MTSHATYVEPMYPVSARKTVDGWLTPGISFDDYARMGTQQRKPSGERRLPTPVWAVNDKLLQELLVNFMEERASIRKKKGTLLERLARAQQAITNQRPRLSAVLDKLCRDYVQIKRFGAYSDLSDEDVLDIAEKVFINRPLLVSDPSGLGARQMLTTKQARDWAIEIEGIDTLLKYTNGASAGAGTIAAIVWLYYRVGMDSVGVGAELGLKPPHVRQTLWRLHETARKLWPSQAEGIGGVEVKTLNVGHPNSEASRQTLGRSAIGDDANGTPASAYTRAGLSTPPLQFPVL